MNDEPKLLWVNHASYVLAHDGIRLMTDPWLEGLAFNRGWSLLAPSRFGVAEFERITHIWISHEHPDHFSPPNLLKIPEATRKGITILFQQTRDGRVAKFCRDAGFRVVELAHGRRVELSPSFAVVCGMQGRDSWLSVTCGRWKVLNLNDCIFRSENELDSVMRIGGIPDVLLTQFSYANWSGNPGDSASMREAAQAKLREFRRRVEVFKPRWVIPFASFAWFAHEENLHLNEYANRIGDMIGEIRQLKRLPIVLYPGEEWVIGSEHDPIRAADHYEEDRILAQQRAAVTSKSVALDQLLEASASFVTRLRSRNWLWVLRPLEWAGILRPMRLYVRDLDVTAVLPVYRQMSVLGAGCRDAELELSSDSLFFIFKNDYGIDSLLVNGRFRELVRGSRAGLSKLFAVARHNSDGHYYPGRLLELGYLNARLRRARSL